MLSSGLNPYLSTRLVPAEQIEGRPNKEIYTLLDGILSEINDRIETASREGRSEIKYELPTIPLPNIKLEDSQIFLLSEILSIYGEKTSSNEKGLGYRVRHANEKGKTIIYIRWNAFMDDGSRERRMKFINMYRRTSDDF